MAQIQMEVSPRLLLLPAGFLVVTLFCFNFIGDGLRMPSPEHVKEAGSHELIRNRTSAATGECTAGGKRFVLRSLRLDGDDGGQRFRTFTPRWRNVRYCWRVRDQKSQTAFALMGLLATNGRIGGSATLTDVKFLIYLSKRTEYAARQNRR